jgi:hypothetical protein
MDDSGDWQDGEGSSLAVVSGAGSALGLGPGILV